MISQQQLLAVIEIQTEIVKLGLDLGQVMALVVERTLPLIGADGAAIELAEGDDMVYRAVSGIAQPHLGLRLHRSSSLSGRCVAAGQVLRCDDSEQDPRVDRQACRAVGLRSMLVQPLRYQDETVGVLKAMATQAGKFSAEDERLLALLSEVVAAAMYFAAKFDKDEIYYRATHDALTDLANRSVFMERLRQLVARQRRERQPAAVLMIDMDGLKQINDTFGHRVGDVAIREMASRLKATSRLSDTVARLGGDEFGMILNPVDMPDGIEAAIRRLNGEITPPFSFEDREYRLHASIGAATYPEDGDDLEQLLEVADRRMYAVKQARYRSEAATI